MFTEAESIRILQNNRPRKHAIRSTIRPTENEGEEGLLQETLGSIAFPKRLSSPAGMTLKEIAEAIEMTPQALRYILAKQHAKSDTLTRSLLDDLVFDRVLHPFSLHGYEVNAQIAAAIRKSDMEEWWRILRRYKYREEAAISQAKFVARKLSTENPHTAYTFGPWDWDSLVFSNHYLQIKTLLPARFSVNPEAFIKTGKATRSTQKERRIAEIRRYFETIDQKATKDQNHLVSSTLLRLLQNWRHFRQYHLWTIVMEFKVALNSIGIVWENTPREERATPDMRCYLESVNYMSCLENYSEYFPSEITPVFNRLAIASVFQEENLYEYLYTRLCHLDPSFESLAYLLRHPDGDGDFDNFVAHWRRRWPAATGVS